jgi:hypothetical protein
MCPGEQRYPARRWVIARTLAWRPTGRGLLIRDETKAVHDVGLQPLVCAGMGVRRWAPRIVLPASLPLDWSHATKGRGSALYKIKKAKIKEKHDS